MFEPEDAIERRAASLILAHETLLRDLVRMRTKHNLTQLEVAERMGVSQPTVAGFERYDANPTLSTIRRYALAVQARIEERVVDDCADPRSVNLTAGASEPWAAGQPGRRVSVQTRMPA